MRAKNDVTAKTVFFATERANEKTDDMRTNTPTPLGFEDAREELKRVVNSE